AHAGAEPSIDQKLTRARCFVKASVNQALHQASSDAGAGRRPMTIACAQLEGRLAAMPPRAASSALQSLPAFEMFKVCAPGNVTFTARRTRPMPAGGSASARGWRA